jgi:hypothetical protein
MKWPRRITTNEKISEMGGQYFFNPTPGSNTDKQLESVLPVVVALGLNFKAQKIPDLAKLEGIAGLIDATSQIPLEIKRQLPELFH